MTVATEPKAKLPRGKSTSHYPPAENAREQARNRRAMKRAGADPAETPRTEFTEAFCRELARKPWDAPGAHFLAELSTKTDLDLSGYEVDERNIVEVVKGAEVTRKMRTITFRGLLVTEQEARIAQAQFLASLPEVKARVAELREQMAAQVKVSAQSLAMELEEARLVALSSNQPQAAVSATRLKAEMFGKAEPGDPGDEGGELPLGTKTVTIKIKDCSGRPKAAAE